MAVSGFVVGLPCTGIRLRVDPRLRAMIDISWGEFLKTVCLVGALLGLWILLWRWFVSGLLEIYEHRENLLEWVEWSHAADQATVPRIGFLYICGRTFSGWRVDAGGFDIRLVNTPINHHEYALGRWADHRLVYAADFYLVQVGNKSLDLG
ncbi:unnamed protein product, partial [Tuber aestivum]